MRQVYVVIAAMLLLAVQGVVGVQVFSEDFESYSTYNISWYNAAPTKWLYVGVSNVGTPGASSNASQYIASDGGNKYLYLTAYNPIVNGGKKVEIRGNWTNSNATVQHDWSFAYNIKLFGSAYSTINGWPTIMRQTHAGADLHNFGLYGGSATAFVSAPGGKYNGTSQEDFEGLRRRIDLSGLADGYPSDSQCDINDGNWHRVTVHVHYNGSLNQYDQVNTYVDGVSCENSTQAAGVVTSGSTYKYIEWESWLGMTVGIDEVSVSFHEYEDPVGVSECSNSVDDDGDGYIDYPADPSCISADDNTESPYDYTQCNNGIDDDGDGYIDYPADPSCTNLTDNTESPKDVTYTDDDECIVEEGCLLKDTVPYSDEIGLHGWEGTTGSVRTVNIFGDYKLYMDTDSNTTRFNITKNITNLNIYNNVRSNAHFYFDMGAAGLILDYNNYTMYWEHLDSEDRVVNSIQFDISRSSSPEFLKVIMSSYNGSEYVYVATLYPSYNAESRVQFYLYFDQVLKIYDMEYQVFGSGIETVTGLGWANVLSSKIYKTRLADTGVDNSKVEVYVDNLNIFSDDVTYDTVCDEWGSPYYLDETFNGYPMACGWSANLNIFFNGQYKLYDTTSLYSQQKKLPVVVKDSNTRYVTLAFDAMVESFTNNGNTIIRVYDSDSYNFLTLYWQGDPVKFLYDEDSSGVVAATVPKNQTYDYMSVIDFQEDKVDIYFNGSLVADDAGLTDNFFNLEDMEYVKLSTRYTGIEIDNLVLYASDSAGTPLLPDEDILPVVENETMMCGLVYKQQPLCTEDADCASGQCNVNGKCSKYDKNYCDENGWAYGNKCFLAGTASCVLSTTGNMIVDNFFMFLVLLVIIMFMVYIVIMFRR